MIIQLREYESGTYGLEEAVQQIKELKKLKEARELRIEELIQAGNELGDEANQIELENLELRKQLGISQDTVVRVDGIISRQRQEQKELNLLKKQLETQENLIVDFKVERHELLKKINLLMKEKPTQGSFEEYPEHNDKAIKPYSSVADEEAHILENKLKDVIEENEALRKGMHEILDSIKETESNSLIRIESTCLERLLEALDSRHVNGWYHPAMRLQAQVFALQGMNTILREELRLARLQEHQPAASSGQSRPHTSGSNIDPPHYAPSSPSHQGGPYTGSGQVDSYIENHMEESQQLADCLKQELKILTEKLAEEQDANQIMSTEMNALKSKLLEIKDQTILIDEEYEAEKLSWQKVREGMGQEIEQLKQDVQDKQVILHEHESNWSKVLEENPDELKTHLTHLNTKLVNVLNEKCQLTRKVNILIDSKNAAQSKIATLEEHVTNMKAELVRMTAQHDKVKEQFTRELDSLRQTYEDCPSAEEVNNLKQELYDVTVKYRSTLQSISDVLKHDPLEADTPSTGSGSHIPSNQIRQLEEKCQQFEKKLAVMVESEKSFQKFQTKLAEKYAESVSKVEYQNVLNKLRDAERQAAQLKTENANFLEMLNEAHSKLKQIELRKAYHEFEHDALQRCILELQCISDDKSTIGRLTQEIHSLHVNEIKNQDTLQSVQRDLEIAQKTVQELQDYVESLRAELSLQKQIYNDKIRQLKSLILYLNKRFVGALPLLSEEIWSNQVKRINQEKLQLIKCTRHQIDDSEIQAASIDNLRVQLKTLTFAKTSVDKRLEVAEEVISKYEALVNSLQSDMITMEQKYEKLLLEAHNVEEKLDKWNKKEEIKLEVPKDEEPLKPKAQPEPKPRTSVDKPEPITKKDDNQLSTTIDKLQEELREKMKNVEDKNEIIEKYNVEMRKLNEKVNELQGKLIAKEEQLRSKIEDLESFKTAIRNKSVAETMNSRDEAESSEKKAYKVTVSSLENIIAQKEITIKNYQALLEKTKEQNVQTMLDLQNKCSNLQSLLHSKEKADSKTKLDSKPDLEASSDLRPYMNTYLTRIHELEDNLVQVSNELAACKQQSEHWYHMASERLKVITDLQLKLESYKTADDNELMAELQEKNEEIAKLQNIIKEHKTKPAETTTAVASGEKNDTNKSRLKNEIEVYKRKLEGMTNHEKELKKEIQKLKDQISHLKPISGKSREELLSAKEEMYTKKIKQLKEEIEEYRKREEKDKFIRKMKCDEEVEKWTEKKQWQTANEKLKQQLKDKTNQYDALRITHDRLKETVMKLERERFMLESKLKAKDSQLASQGVVENLEREIRRLEEELSMSRRENEFSGVAKSNKDLIEHLRRKLFVYENAQKGDRKLAEELENAIERKTLTHKRNLKLEAENSQLKQELDKLKQSGYRQPIEMSEINQMNLDLDSLTEEEGSSDKIQVKSKQRRTADLEKAVTVLKRVVDKLQAENKRLYNKHVTLVQEKEYTEKIQIELQKSQANYLDAVERCSSLEAELREARAFSNKGDHEEIQRLNSQLAQKGALLSRVKLLLERAAARERSLTEQIKFLQSATA
ncbi:hypothetical protein M8J76_010394 [Diaphorina citri]|nr:hypothetical protein M8J76_010394 [Diaphorina citri]